MAIENVQAARQLLQTDLGDSPLGKLGGHSLQVGASAQPQAAAPASLLDSVKAFGSRHFGSGTTAAVYANQKLQYSVQTTSQKVGDLIATLCRPGSQASANELQQLSRSLLSGAQDAADIAQLTPEKVVQMRVGLHVAQLNMAELQALHSSLKQLGAGGNDAVIDILQKEVAAHVLERETAIVEQAARDLGASMDVNLGIAAALQTYGNSAAAQANWQALKDMAKDILTNAGFGALSDSDMERKCESLILQTMGNLMDSASSNQEAQTIAHNLTQFFLAALPSTSMHSLVSNEYRLANQEADLGVQQCLMGAMQSRTDQLEAPVREGLKGLAATAAYAPIPMALMSDLKLLASHCAATNKSSALQPNFASLDPVRLNDLCQAMELVNTATPKVLEPVLGQVQAQVKANDLRLLDASFDALSATLEKNLELSAKVHGSYDAAAAQATWTGLKAIAQEFVNEAGFGALSPKELDAKSEALLLSVMDRIVDRAGNQNPAINIAAFFQSALDDQALFDLANYQTRLEKSETGLDTGSTELALMGVLGHRGDRLEAGARAELETLRPVLTAASTGGQLVTALQTLATSQAFQALKKFCNVTGAKLELGSLFQETLQELRAKAQAQDPTLDALQCAKVLTLLGKQVSVPNDLRALIQNPDFSTEARSYFGELKAAHSPEYSTFYEMYQAYIAQPSAAAAQALVDACVEDPAQPASAEFNALTASPIYLNISHQDSQAIHAGVANYGNQQMFQKLIDPLFREVTLMVGSPVVMEKIQRTSLAAQL